MPDHVRFSDTKLRYLVLRMGKVASNFIFQGDTSVVVLSFYVLVFLCCWRLMYVFIFLVKFR